MIRKMIHSEQMLSNYECECILINNTHGILAVMGDEEYPYGVPLNYVYMNRKIYFHCAKKGYKLDCIEKLPKVSFTVVDMDEIHPEDVTSYFRSVIIMGRAYRVQDEEYKNALRGIADKYMAGMPEEAIRSAVEQCGFGGALIYAVEPDHITGKQASELMSK